MFEIEKLPPPDNMGFFFHPDIPGEEESDDVKQMCKDLGFDSYFVALEYDDPILFDAWGEEEDYDAPLRWEPTKPDGEGWLLVAKYDTEDGPYSMFVKPLDNT